MKLIYEKSRPGRRAGTVPNPAIPRAQVPEALRRRAAPRLPELAEPEIVRHFTQLSTRKLWNRHGFLPTGLVHDEAQSARQ